MKTGNLLPIDPVTSLDLQEDDFFLMANLSSRLTGLPFIVWVSTRGNARHDVRVKVARGRKVKPEELISVALRPAVREVGDTQLSPDELDRLRRWVAINYDVLLEYWNEDLATDEMIVRLQPVA